MPLGLREVGHQLVLSLCLCGAWFVIPEDSLAPSRSAALRREHGEVKELSTAAWRCWAATGTMAVGELGQVLWRHSPSWGREEDAGSEASPSLDQPPQPAGCRAVRRLHRADWSNGQPETENFWRSTTPRLPCHKTSLPCLQAGPLCHFWREGGPAPVAARTWISRMSAPSSWPQALAGACSFLVPFLGWRATARIPPGL